MSRPTACQIVMEGKKRFVVVHFTDKVRPEFFMNIEVSVDGNWVYLKNGNDGQIGLPKDALRKALEIVDYPDDLE